MIRSTPPGLQVSHRDPVRDPKPGDRWRGALGHEYLVVEVTDRGWVLLDVGDGRKPWHRETVAGFRGLTAAGWLVDSADGAHLRVA